MKRNQLSQSGFTVVEVLVAITISLILLLGVINIFNASKQSYTLQNGVARLQENARYALEIMARSISLAGLNQVPNTNIDPFVLANTSEGGTNVSDTISVTYASATDCLGNATGGVTIDTFAITAATMFTPAVLTCNGTSIVEGIENMQILYGQDDTSHPGAVSVQRARGIPDRYLSFDKVTLTSDESEDGGITSVRIALLVSTVNDVNDMLDSSTYFLLNATALGPYDDRQIRRVFTRTVLLRNYYNRPKNPSY